MERPIQFGPYVLLEKLGEGAQGDVHLARHVRQADAVVIKRMHPRRASDEAFIRRFRHEAMIATSVESPYVIKVLDVGRVEDHLYIAMEYVAGWPLSRVIKDLHDTREKASLPSVADVIVGALEGLHALHTAQAPDGRRLGIVHRDIAPKNLMLSESGQVKVIDLGLGKSTRQDWATATGIVMGTPGYMSPEQATAEAVDHRADIFAMGIVLFELLTLDRYMPVRPVLEMLAATLRSQYRPPSSIRGDVPAALDAIVKRAVEIDPAKRFPSARLFADAIREVIPAHESTSAKSLLTSLAWNEVTKTNAEVKRLLEHPMEIDETEISKRIVFSTRVEQTSQTIVGPTVHRARGWRRTVTAGAGALLVAAGWFGRGWLETPAPVSAPVVREEPEQPIDEPRPSVTVRPHAETAPEEVPRAKTPVKQARIERRRAAPKRDEPAIEAPPPPAPPKDLRQEVSRLAKGAMILLHSAPVAEKERAKELAAKLNRLQSLPSLDGQEKNIQELELELRALTSRSRAE